MEIKGYPDFNRLSDPAVAHHFRLIWDVARKLAEDTAAIPTVDIAGVQAQLAALTRTVQNDGRNLRSAQLTIASLQSSITTLQASLAALTAVVDGKASKAYSLVYAVAGNAAGSETDVSSSGYSVTLPAISSTGAGFRVSMAGTLAANTNPKTVRLYLNGVVVASLASSTSIGGNRWRLIAEVTREDVDATMARSSFWGTRDAISGNTPTLVHYAQEQLAGVAWAGTQNLHLTLQGTLANDIRIVTWAVEPIE